MLLLIPNKNYCEESNIKTNKENLINLEDGYYKIHVKLWHAHEDKESMGNKAMVQVAELEVKDSEKYLYIGTEKMDYLNITASLVSIFFQKNDGNFYPGEGGDYEMEIPNENEKRPTVFRIKLENVRELINVYVDPKVGPMGGEPIRARIKLDYDSIEKIDKNQAELIKKFETGPKKPEFDSSSSGEAENKSLIVNYEPGTFDEEFSFYGNKLSGKNAEEYSKDFDKLDQVNIFKIEFLGPLDEIKEEDKKIQDKRKKIIPKKEMELRLPLLKFTKEDNLALYDFTNGEKKKLEFTFDKDHVKAKVKNPGVYVLVKSGDALVPNANTESSENKLPIEKKNEKAEKFLKTVKKTKPKPIGNKTNRTTVNTENTNNIKPLNPQPNAPSSLQKQMDLANKENKTKNLNKEADTIQEREYSGLIIFILMVFLTFNILSIYFIRKNLDAIRDMREEILFIGGLRKDEK